MTSLSPARPSTAALRADGAPAAPPTVAIIGAGVAGAACAAALRRAGFDVTVFDKSRGVGGRMATRRAAWTGSGAAAPVDEFDHGCPYFTAIDPRFRAVADEAQRRGALARWSSRLADASGVVSRQEVLVPIPNMPAFCRHLLEGVPLRLGRAVTGLQRRGDAWQLGFAPQDTESAEGELAAVPGFAQVVLAIPPAQAAVLLTGHQDEWAGAFATLRMAPCWTLMAVTDDLDVAWDALASSGDVLSWTGRNDRKPGRADGVASRPDGRARWVAHASPAWSQAHLEDDPARVVDLLSAAFTTLVGAGAPLRLHHRVVHRWRYARPVATTASIASKFVWCPRRGIGACGDWLADGSVEGAWCSGDELAAAIAASRQASADSDAANAASAFAVHGVSASAP